MERDTRNSLPTQLIKSVKMVTQKSAIPLTVTTRGIGFATAIFYDRAMTTSSGKVLVDIASIHQVFRIALWLAHYKVFLAQQCQVDPLTEEALMRIVIHDDFRETLNSVREVPSVLAVVLNSIGKIKTRSHTYHMGYAVEPTAAAEAFEYRTLVITPDNLRQTLEILINAATPAKSLAEFRRYCSIPGLQFDASNRPTNIDDVYPSVYTDNQLLKDVSAFKNLITAVQTRLPKHTILKHSWNGKAVRSGLWSCARTDSRVDSQFRSIGAATKKIPAGRVYTSSVLIGERTTHWSRERTPHDNVVVGIGSMVGEVCFVATRDQLQADHSVVNTAVTILQSIGYAL